MNKNHGKNLGGLLTKLLISHIANCPRVLKLILM